MTRGTVRPIGALASLTIAAFLFVTSETLPIGLLTSISEATGTSDSAVGLLVTGYAAVVVIATVPLARVTRGLPRKQVLTALLLLFAITTSLGAIIGTYPALLVTRAVSAGGHALFWAVVTPTVATLLPEKQRGRAISVVYAGAALAPVVGVPIGTLVGQVTDWRIAFTLLAVVATISMVGVVASLPSGGAVGAKESSDRARTPDRRRFWSIVLVTVLSVTGAFVSFTYVTPFLREVTELPPSLDAVVLLVRGAAGFVGVLVVGLFLDRAPWLVTLVLMGLQLVALAVQQTSGDLALPVVASLAGSGIALAALSGANATRVLLYAPGNTVEAAGIVSTAFNFGIMAGALLGGIAVQIGGLGVTPLIGAVLTAGALAVLIAEHCSHGSHSQRGTRRSDLRG